MASSFEELGIKVISGKVRFATLCPKCSHLRKKKNLPCLTVNNEPDNRWWKCWNCGWSGNLDLYDKYKQVQEKSRMPGQIPDLYSREVMEYWKKRGIDYRICVKEKVFEYSMGREHKPIIGFPVFINLTLVNVKYLNIRYKEDDDSPKWWQLPKEYGTRILPIGLQSLQWEEDKPKIVIWTEGELDRLTWMSAGYKNVISEPQGAPSVKTTDFKEKFAYTEDPYFKSVIADVDLFIFSTDGDEPGRLLRNQLALRFKKEKCKYINYPVGYKDINEVWMGDEKKGLKALGQEGIDECYQNISSFPVRGVVRLIDDREALERLAEKGLEPGLKIGVKEIDELYTTKPARLEVLVGIPKIGKSVYKRWHTTELIKHNEDLNLKFALFTPENRPTSREKAMIAEIITGQLFQRGFHNSMDEALREKVLWYIEKHFFFIAPDKKNFESWDNEIKDNQVNTLKSILRYLEYLKKTEDIFGYIVDAWNKVDHEQPKYMSDTNFISKQLDYLLDFNAYYNLHGSLIVHPTKIEKHGSNFRFPNLYDGKGSSAWFEKVDVGLVCHRYLRKRKKNEDIPDNAEEDDKYEYNPDAPFILGVDAIRFEEEGKVGRVKLKMDYSKGRRFEVIKNEEREPVRKLNPAVKEDDDNGVFNDGPYVDDTSLPF